MPRPTKHTTLDLIQKSLTNDKVKLNNEQQAIKTRWMAAYLFWVDKPTMLDREVVSFIRENFNVSERTAYLDLGAVKQLLGAVPMASKQWYRHTVITMAKEAFSTAQTKDDAAGMAAAASVISKACQLDKSELDQLPWDEIIPPNFEPSPDISVLGFKPDPNIETRRRKLREKYLRQYDPDHIEDAVVV